MTGENNWTPIGSSSNEYTGKIIGQNKTIYGMNINTSSDDIGFISYLGSDGEISNVTFENAIVNTSTTTNYVGIIVGRNYGMIENCHVKGTSTVAGNRYVGGIVGYSTKQGTVYGCYTMETIEKDRMSIITSGKDGIGQNNGTNQKSYSFSSISSITEAVIENMNTAIEEYGYYWEFVEDNYPLLKQ